MTTLAELANELAAKIYNLGHAEGVKDERKRCAAIVDEYTYRVRGASSIASRIREEAFDEKIITRIIEGTREPQRKAAVAIIQRTDNHCVLCVWNKRYEAWGLPGGMVEEGEEPYNAVVREVAEETDLEVRCGILVFKGTHSLRPKNNPRDGRASEVYVYRCQAVGTPRGAEDGCPVVWLTWSEFLSQSPFGDFYKSIGFEP